MMKEIKISSKLAKKIKILKGVRVSIELLAKIDERGENFSQLVTRLLEEEFESSKPVEVNTKIPEDESEKDKEAINNCKTISELIKLKSSLGARGEELIEVFREKMKELQVDD